MNPQTVSTREFRAELAKYLESFEPLAISKHGRTIGYYIPAHDALDNLEINALERITQQLQTVLNAQGMTEDDVIAEFKRLKSHKP